MITIPSHIATGSATYSEAEAWTATLNPQLDERGQMIFHNDSIIEARVNDLSIATYEDTDEVNNITSQLHMVALSGRFHLAVILKLPSGDTNIYIYPER